MEVRMFRGRTYGKSAGQLYVFEETWDTFRPIVRVVWNGKKFAIDDSIYKSNLFDPCYGFGSLEMKNQCKQITENTELEGKELNPTEFWNWCGTSTEWFHDRPCVLSGCESRDWKKFIVRSGSKPRTLRHAPAPRVTRRLVAKGLKV
jgi:hypothetical protein